MPDFAFASRERKFQHDVPAGVVKVINQPALGEVRRKKIEPGMQVGWIAGLLTEINVARIPAILSHAIARNTVIVVRRINIISQAPLLEIGNAIDSLGFGFS